MVIKTLQQQQPQYGQQMGVHDQVGMDPAMQQQYQPVCVINIFPFMWLLVYLKRLKKKKKKKIKIQNQMHGHPPGQRRMVPPNMQNPPPRSMGR